MTGRGKGEERGVEGEGEGLRGRRVGGRGVEGGEKSGEGETVVTWLRGGGGHGRD